MNLEVLQPGEKNLLCRLVVRQVILQEQGEQAVALMCIVV